MDIGGRGAERVKYQRQANCRTDPSARTAHKKRHSLVLGPQEHESGPDQECDARRMATAKPQCTRPNWCQVSWESHRPGGDLGGMQLGTLSGDYVA